MLSLKQSRCPGTHAPAASPWGATWADVCPMGLHRLSTGTAHSPRGTRQRPSLPPRLQLSPSTRPQPTVANCAQPARTYPQLAQPGQHTRNALTVLAMARENMGHEVARHHVAV